MLRSIHQEIFWLHRTLTISTIFASSGALFVAVDGAKAASIQGGPADSSRSSGCAVQRPACRCRPRADIPPEVLTTRPAAPLTLTLTAQTVRECWGIALPLAKVAQGEIGILAKHDKSEKEKWTQPKWAKC